MSSGKVRVYFYGSYMDTDTLSGWRVRPLSLEVARLDDWGVTFSPYATLIPRAGDSVYGIVAELTESDVERLYSRRELADYKPVEVIVETATKRRISAICYASKPSENLRPSPAYIKLVVDTARKLGFPPAYIEKLNGFAE